MKLYHDLMRRIEDFSLPEIFYLFALVSLILFPLVFFVNKGTADLGFVFAFICLSAGVAFKIVKGVNRLTVFGSSIFFKYRKLILFTALSLVFLNIGYRWSGIPGILIFLPVITGMIYFRRYGIKTSILRDDTENYSFKRKDLYYIGVLLLLNLFSIRKLMISEPIVFYDWFGFGKEALDYLSFGIFPSNTFEFFATPIIILIGNELASNVILLAFIPIASITFYFLAARVLRNRNAAFVAAFLYIFNPAITDRFLSAHIGILIGYAFMPVVFMFFILSLESGNSRTSITFSIVSGAILAFSGLLASSFFYINALLIIIYWITHSALNDFRYLKKGFLMLTIVFIIAVFLASPWLFTSVKLSSSGFYSSTATQNYVESLSTQTYLFNNLRLIGQSGGPFMENLGYLGFSFWGLLGFVMVLAGFSSHILHTQKKEKAVIIFSSITLIGFIFSTGAMYLGESYLWLFNNIPFFIAFREPSKFLIIAGFGLSMLAGITVEAVISLRGKTSAKFLVPFFISTLILSQAIFSWPMFTGDNMLYSQHPKYTISGEYRELGAWIDSQDESFKVIILPYTGFTIRTWHMVSKKESVYIGTSCLIPSNSDICQYSIFMMETIEGGDATGFSILTGLKGIKYIIVQKDLDTRNLQEGPDEYNFIPPSTRFNISGPSIAQLLENSYEFRKTKEFGPYTVFENLRFIENAVIEKQVLAIGDRNLIFEMAKRTDFNKTEIVFTNLLTQSELARKINNTEVILSKHDENEPIFLMLADKYKINVYDHAFPAGLGDDPRNIIYRKWIRSDIYEFLEGGVFGRGAVTYGRGYAISRGNSKLSIPYSPPENGHYQLWARLLHAPGRGEISILLDGENAGSISPESSDFEGFRWVMIGEANLSKRTYDLKIMNSNGENVIDQIAFLPGEYSGDLQLKRIINESKNR